MSFVNQMVSLLGIDEFNDFFKAMLPQIPTSIRVRSGESCPFEDLIEGEVPWCKGGYYLRERPSFTMDPLLHAGAYYVQEASSMFIAHLIGQYIKHPVTALDLCAAPGGKSTLLLSHLPEGSTLIANEINHKRANILAENIGKWQGVVPSQGNKNTVQAIVTNNQASDFSQLGEEQFDFILCDVPCSGEGMFRKDYDAIKEWSTENVKMCARRQKDIISDIWESLKPGGIMIYSTCTYNTQENEENILWISETLGAEILPCNPLPEWNITGNLLKGETFPCCHFLPHKTKGEGFFCAVLCKLPNDETAKPTDTKKLLERTKKLHIIPTCQFQPTESTCETDQATALRYLHGDAITLPQGTPLGIVTLTYQSQPIGQVKNIGTRANNLHPKEWRIKKQI